MESYIQDFLTRFGYKSKTSRPITISASVPYDVLFDYYCFVGEFLVGPDFFKERLLGSVEKPKEAEKILDDLLQKTLYDTPYGITDLMRGAFNIGAASWKRFITPLHWLCKAVDDFGPVVPTEEQLEKMSTYYSELTTEYEKLQSDLAGVNEKIIEAKESTRNTEIQTELAEAEIAESSKRYAETLHKIKELKDDINASEKSLRKVDNVLKQSDEIDKDEIVNLYTTGNTLNDALNVLAPCATGDGGLWQAFDPHSVPSLTDDVESSLADDLAMLLTPS